MSRSRTTEPRAGTLPRVRLVRAAPPSPAAPELDPAQQQVVGHRGGPLLVLAGPGTGKTTTLVEAVVERVERRGVDPARVLVLTFSRKAAAELRDRIVARLGRTIASPTAATFHSFCYALVRAYQPAEAFEQPLRLLSAPEQDHRVRELLAGSVAERTLDWPASIRPAIGTRGLAEQVRAVLARAREHGLEPAELVQLGLGVGNAEWAAVGRFFDEYLQVLDAEGVLDYAELVHRAVLSAERPEVRESLRAAYDVVFVDEYQDTDPGQERLLQALAGDGRDLVVVGDPDQSIYAFRGTRVEGILQFPDRFPRADRRPADVVVLRTSRRSGPALLAASRAVAARLPMPALPADTVRAHRALAAGAVRHGEGQVEALTFPDSAAQYEHVADLLRRAHLEQGVPWSEMAVLVRSGVRSVPPLRRALGAAGVPVEVAGDELPLRAEPAVAPLLLALRCAAEPGALTAEAVQTLLLSPLVGTDPAAVRRLARQLRHLERVEAAGERPLRPSAELLRAAVADPRQLVLVEPAVAAPATRLAGLLTRAREVITAGGTVAEALWALWSATRWPQRLQAAALRGGPAGRRADHDLDAVVALFDTAARAHATDPRRGVRAFLDELEGQQIPGDTLAEQAVRGEAVRLLTAHRSKGLEWRLVVVCDVHEGSWPDLRRRGSFLDPDRLGADGLLDPPTPAGLLAEERRLFYVAVTRASQRLVVTAVAASSDDGEQPSRFLAELGVPVLAVPGGARRPLSTSGLVAALRAAIVDPASSPALRQAAARRLAVLADLQARDGSLLVPAAHPGNWWGTAETTAAEQPVRPAEVPLALSGSAVSALVACPLAWFLSREAHAEAARTTALGFGSVVHALAEEVATGRTPATLEALLARLDTVWADLAFPAPWEAERERAAAVEALRRFLAWHQAERDRTLVATEHAFAVPATLGLDDDDDGAGAGAVEVSLRGFFDRVETDSEGRVHVVDFKTGKSMVSGEQLAAHAQLGVYQLAVRHGALDDLPGLGPQRPECAGAELVQLRTDRDGLPAVQAQQPLPAQGRSWIEELVLDAAARVREERFDATPHEGCDRCPFRRCCPARPEGREVVQ